MKTLLILTFLLVYLFFGNELGYTATSPWWTHLTYSFQHANLMHLLLNSISFHIILRTLRRFTSPWKTALLSLSVAILASFLPPCSSSLPTVGASGMIYAMLGQFLSLVITRRALPRNRLHLITFLSTLALPLVLGFFRPHTAALLHLTCFFSGTIASCLIPILKKNRRRDIG